MMKINRLTLLLPIAMMITGCSTLLIEVDVYNGPLNSQAPERLDQVAAMVSAARPMLGFIRDTYQCDDELNPVSSELCRRIDPIEVDSYRTYLGAGVYPENERKITYYLANEILHMYTNEQTALQVFYHDYELLIRKLQYQEEVYDKYLPSEAGDAEFIERIFAQKSIEKSNEINAVRFFIAPSKEGGGTNFSTVFCKSERKGDCTSRKILSDLEQDESLRKEIKSLLRENQFKEEKAQQILDKLRDLGQSFDAAWQAVNGSVLAAAKTAISLNEMEQSGGDIPFKPGELAELKSWLLNIFKEKVDLVKVKALGLQKCPSDLETSADLMAYADCVIAAQNALAPLNITSPAMEQRVAKAPDDGGRLEGKMTQLPDQELILIRGLGTDASRGLEAVIHDYKKFYYRGCYEEKKPNCESAEDVKREFQSDLKSFSEKILFLANNLVLLHGNANLDDDSNSGENNPQRIKKFIAVLQAIGNSTKVLTNDIERQNQFTTRNNGDNAKLLKNAISNTIRSEAGIINVTEDLALWLDSEERLKPYTTCVANNKSRCDVLERLKTTLRTSCLTVESDDTEMSVNWRAKNITNCIKSNYPDPAGTAPESLSEMKEVLENYLSQLQEATTEHNLPSFDENDQLNSELNTEQVWDSLMYHLAVERVLADKRGDTEQVKQLNKALETARYFRSENSFLRATSDAIRMTMRSTTLLNEFELIQRKKFLNRSLVQSSNAILQELDNQNWHNINRVAVKGGGDVNYVVAKDDIGNWYIKQYSEDKKEMIDSIKSIALFNIKKSNISKLATYVPSGVSEAATQSTSEKVYTSFLSQHTLPLRNELVKQMAFLADLEKSDTHTDKPFLGLEDAQKSTEKILENTQELKSSRGQVANGVLENIYLLARFYEGLGDCADDNASKQEQCSSTKQQIANKVKNSVAIMRQHTAQVEPFVLAFIGAIQD
ncbi:hypothetical protein CWC29_020625 [Pseudoalteromonas sp. S4498]|uniref:hypothetical protein n=1 Tax=Pseudoalteromonas TaxID=53246 RepID=UPI00110A07F7|nr:MULTISPECIES: hypothetical protein [Pseudoalteromonas]MCG9761412.1 hypothetical protein [Pseudoalteromonas sp. Isolate6]NKC21190.1 hypothetical protein [Pseudoalteromonas galatheae]